MFKLNSYISYYTLVLILCMGVEAFGSANGSSESEIKSESKNIVFAVGEAKLEKEKFIIREALVDRPLGAQQIKTLDEFMELILNDFLFYKSIFNVRKLGKVKANEFETPTTEGIVEGETNYVVHVKALGAKDGHSESITSGELSLRVILFKNKISKVFDSSVTIKKEDVRKKGHQLAQEMYQTITGKDSIFNSKIVFVCDRNSTPKKMVKEIYLSDFDGKNIKQVSSHGSITISPAISYDGKKIVYSLIDTGSTVKAVNLYLLDLESERTKKVSSLSGLNTGAVFLPGDEKVALTLSHEGNANIYVLDLSGGEKTPLITGHGEDVDPSFSRDGKKMAFLSDRSGSAMIYTADPTGKNKSIDRISFVGKFNASPRFSPLGDEIVFSSWVDNAFDLYRINAQTKELFRLTKNFGTNEDPSFSNDGQFIVFSSQTTLRKGRPSRNIFIMDKNGEILGQLTRNLGNCLSPRWSN